MCTFPPPPLLSSNSGSANILNDRWVGGATSPHRILHLVKDHLLKSIQMKDEERSDIHITMLYPQSPADFASILDDIIRSASSSSSDPHSQRWFVLCNVDILLARSHTAATLGLFMWSVASLIHHHGATVLQHVRLLFSALDDEQGQLAVDLVLSHLDRTLRVPGAHIASRGNTSTRADEEAPILRWAPIISDEDNEEEENMSTTSSAVARSLDVRGVVELVAKKAASIHTEICDNMLSGDVSVDDAPVVILWCGSGHTTSGSGGGASRLASVVQEELTGIYVPEPFRIVATPEELRHVAVPFESSPVIVIADDASHLLLIAAAIVDKGMRLHSVVVLGLRDGLVAPLSGLHDAQSAAARFSSLEMLRSDVLWIETLLASTTDVFCPPQCMQIQAHRSTIQTLIALPANSTVITRRPEDIADVSVFLVWLGRRFLFEKQRSLTAGDTAALVAPKLSRRQVRKAQFQAKHAITSNKNAGSSSSTKSDRHYDVLITIPRALLLGHKDSSARRQVWDALEYLLVTQLCELIAAAPSEATRENDDEEGDADDERHDAASSLQMHAMSPMVTLSLTPIGRFLTEDWKYRPISGPVSPPRDDLASVLRSPSGFESIVIPKLLLAACTMRLPLDATVALLEAANLTTANSTNVIVQWCQSRGVRVPSSTNVLDISADMLHSMKRVVVLWASIPHSSFAQAALRETKGVLMSRVEALLCAPHATRQSLVPAPAKATSCRGWFPSSTVKAHQVDDRDASSTEASRQQSSSANNSTTVAADSVATYRFPPVHDLCEILLDANRLVSHSQVSSYDKNTRNESSQVQFLCETPVELSELLVATKLLVTSMLTNNCILSQAEPLTASADGGETVQQPHLRTNFLDVKLLQSATWNSILSGTDVQQSLSGATASGLWMDGKFYDSSIAPQTRLDELNHITHHSTSLLEFCDRTALLLASATRGARTEGAGDPNVFSGATPAPKDKKIIDEVINTVARIGREKTEKGIKGKRGFAFLDESDVNNAYYVFHVTRLAS